MCTRRNATRFASVEGRFVLAFSRSRARPPINAPPATSAPMVVSGSQASSLVRARRADTSRETQKGPTSILLPSSTRLITAVAQWAGVEVLRYSDLGSASTPYASVRVTHAMAEASLNSAPLDCADERGSSRRPPLAISGSWFLSTSGHTSALALGVDVLNIVQTVVPGSSTRRIVLRAPGSRR